MHRYSVTLVTRKKGLCPINNTKMLTIDAETRQDAKCQALSGEPGYRVKSCDEKNNALPAPAK